jgi:hypothetical protein
MDPHVRNATSKDSEGDRIRTLRSKTFRTFFRKDRNPEPEQNEGLPYRSAYTPENG